jgi:hypothetical protein
MTLKGGRKNRSAWSKACRGALELTRAYAVTGRLRHDLVTAAKRLQAGVIKKT